MKKIVTYFRLAIVAILILTPSLLFAQTGKVSGKVVDSNNGESVFGVTVIARAEKKSTKTDFDGKYSLDLPPGSHTVEFIMIGYETQKKTVNVSVGGVTSINVTFGTKTLETVEVSDRGLNNTEASLLALQKKSSSVSDGISQEAIKKSPDSSAGEVVKRVTGITLIGGKYVFVRGLGERYSNTVLNNAVLPSTEPDKRVVPMDIFPSNLLKNVRILKTAVPEEPGEFSGGLVKVETQEYPDKFTMSAGFGVGRNFQTTGNKFLTFEAGENIGGLPTGRLGSNDKLPSIANIANGNIPFEPGNRFGGLPQNLVALGSTQFPNQWTPQDTKAGYDKSFNFSIGNTFQTTSSGQRFGIMFGTTYSNQFRFREDKTVRYIPGNLITRDLKETSFLTRVQAQDTKVYTEEVLWGNNLNFAYEFTKGQQIYWKNLYSSSSDKIVRDATGKDYIANVSDFNSLTNIFTSRQLFNSSFGGDHALNYSSSARPMKLEWQMNYSNAKRDEPNLTSQVWRRTIDTFNNFTRLGNNPDGSRFYSTTEDNVRNPSVKLDIPFNQWDGLKAIFKVGYSHVDREKNFTFREFGYKSTFANNPSIDNFNQGLATLYPIPGEITYNPLLTISNAKAFAERQVEPNAYNAFQKLNATFAQVDLPLINKVRFIGGVRYEDSYQKVKTYVTKDSYSLTNLSYGCDYSEFSNSEAVRIAAIKNNVCNANNNGIGELRTKDRLPSGNLVWEFKENMNLRAAYSETITRPDLRELSSFGFSPYFGADRVFGNSDLKRTYIHNYDLRYEWYIKGVDYVGFGLFNKQLSNPIEMIGQPVSGSITARFTYANASQAYIRGVEFDFRKELWNLFRVETNFFFIKSRVDVLDYKQSAAIRGGLLDRNDRAFAYDPTNLSRPLQGQSEFVFNLKWDWYVTKSKNTTLGLYYNYFGDRIYAVGANGTPDAIERGVGLTDLVLQYKYDERYEFKLAARNIMNTRFRIYQKSELTGREELFLSYREGVSVSFSASMKL